MTQMSAIFRRLSFVLAIAAMAMALGAGCSKKPKPDEGTTSTGSADENTLGDSDSGKANGLETVHFGFDSSSLDSGAKNTLNHNAEVLKDKGGLKVQIEGHCDQKGGIQYNIALGEKRANAVKAYLVDKGIAEGRLSTISYGKERPIAQGEGDAVDAKNRRANFVITSR